MEIEPNYRRLKRPPQPPKTERSGAHWVFVIALGVVIGNVLSYTAFELYSRWQLGQLMISFDAMLERQYERNAEAQAKMAEQNEEARKRSERERSVNAQLQQTCAFWREQVRIDDNTKNRNYRDMACARVHSFY